MLTSDTDPDTALGDTRAINAARVGTEAAGGILTTVAGATQFLGTYGTLTFNPDGSYSYALNDTDPDTQALAGGVVATDIFTYRVVDARGPTELAQLTLSITGANDSPVITSNLGGATASISVAENGTAVTTVVAADVDAGTTLTYSISGGADSAKFAINASTGVLTFVAAPDFEAPTDVGGNNIYDVIVQASDRTLPDSQAIAVTVTNQNGVTINGSAGKDTIDQTHTAPGQPLPTSEGDAINGLAGADTLNGGFGGDTMAGGADNDTYFANELSDLVVEIAGEGIDLVRANVTYVLTAEVENLALLGGALDGTGNVLNNLLFGNTAANLLRGLGGNDTLDGGDSIDTLTGGAGADSLTGGVGNDTFVFGQITESGLTATTRDVIADFTVGDKIDVSAIDADTTLAGVLCA